MSYSLTNESMTVTGAGESTDEMVSTKTDEYENEDQNPQEDRGPSQDSPNNQGQSEKQQAESETSHSYTQAQWDELEKSREDPEKKVRELEDKCTKQEEFFKEIFPTKYSTNIPLLCWDFANCLNEKKDLEEKYNETCEKYTKVQKDFQCAERKRQELEQANSDLSNQYKEMSERLNDLEEVNESYNRLYGWYETGIPQCLKKKDCWESFLKEKLEQDMLNPATSMKEKDHATLVFASLAEFAVMERLQLESCFEWKKQLSDIGLVVANYMHQKGFDEGTVIKRLRDFALAFQDSPEVSKRKIVLKVPDLGSDFNVDEVRHLKKGSDVAKIVNWCIIDNATVYSKAIVE